MIKYLNVLNDNKHLQILVIFIVLDVIFGFLRCIKEKKMNSTIGINGIIRKTGMLISIIFTLILDELISIDLLFLIPEKLKLAMELNKCGITILFNSLYVVFESLSILKNMKKCEIPLPRKLNDFLDKLLKEFTSEVEDNDKDRKK